MHAVHVTTPSLERSRTPAVSRGINATSPDDGLEVKNLIKCKESKYVNTTASVRESHKVAGDNWGKSAVTPIGKKTALRLGEGRGETWADLESEQNHQPPGAKESAPYSN